MYLTSVHLQSRRVEYFHIFLRMLNVFSRFALFHCLNVLSLTLAAVTYPSFSDVGEPLFLTPYIEVGQIELGQKLALVNPIVKGVESYAGFLTVNKTCNSNLFFWFFLSETSPEDAPVVVWLQGGPGSSSMFGLFEENGPFFFQKNGTVKTREHYWSKVFNMIYIDNPVGTGFSFTDYDECYAKDEEKIGKELFSAVVQFFELFPALKDNEFYITGESYAGKYVPALAYVIHKNNVKNISNVNLQGIAIGNGLIDPENMMKYSDYFYQLGLIDSKERNVFKEKESEIVKNIQHKYFRKATEIFQTLILGGFIEGGTYFHNFTGFSFIYNILHEKNYSPYGNMNHLIQTDKMRKTLHVGNLTFQADLKVEEFLYDDIMKSVKPWLEVILENYQVLLYSGQLDSIVPYPCTLSFLDALDWSGAHAFKNAPRQKWLVDSNLAGYYRSAQSLTEVLVRNAGHMVPGDQPVWAFDLINRFIINKSF